jgi:hypothetical protein
MNEFTPAQLNRMDTARLAAYRTNLDFYNGSQWPTTSRHRQLVFNYAKVAIDKITSFLMQGLGFACFPNSTNSTNSHVILSGEYREESHVSRSRALGRAADGSRILEEALDPDLSGLGIDILEQVYDPNLQTATRAQERADAILRTQQTQRTQGTIVVPTNCGQELYDVVEVTDARVGLAATNHRIVSIQTDYARRNALYEQKLTLGAP